MKRKRGWLIALAVLGIFTSFPPQWYPDGLRISLSRWLGAPGFRSLPESRPAPALQAGARCPGETPDYGGETVIEGVRIAASPGCQSDNPFTVAAAVRGTNNVSHDVLARSGLAPDTVVKGDDLDGDGDPDVIHIRLEVVELNGSSPEITESVMQFEMAPGIKPGLWVFAPPFAGMSTENFESLKAREGIRAPSPAIRVEQGDRVFITLQNTHYMPHTLHLHGSDHAFRDVTGEGNDGVPIASELPVMPGQSRTYELQARNTGTKFYHCHVQPQVHVMMGLQGLFIIEENRPQNWLQTLNIGAGLVRAPSVAVRELYDREYDLHYTDVDTGLNGRIQSSNDVRVVTESMHRQYDATDATSDYFALNGLSFPYTFRDSLVWVAPDERVKLRVVNGGRDGMGLHTHGHTMTITHRDGVMAPPGGLVTRDVVWIAPAQRVDLELNTRNDGVGSFGPGIWLFHDHGGRAITTDGIGPGGHISAIVYEDQAGPDGWPQTTGVNWDPFFTEAYYRREIPVWEEYAPGLFGEAGPDRWLLLRITVMAALTALLLILITGVRPRD